MRKRGPEIFRLKGADNVKSSGLEGDDPDDIEVARRLFWAVLLLEKYARTHFDITVSACTNHVDSEIAGQLDVAKSDIWSLDEDVPLPTCRQTWHFSPETASPGSVPSTSRSSIHSIDTTVEQDTKSYFLAEIAMLRMLHRCNTAVKATSAGKYVYAPGIALELWFGYLPDMHRFEKGHTLQPHDSTTLPSCVLFNFLRVQYYCCKVSIYWPAVYQVMHDGVSSDLLLNHCTRFFESYIHLAPSIVAAFHDCQVNRWTLFVRLVLYLCGPCS